MSIDTIANEECRRNHTVFGGLHSRTLRQLARHLRGAAILENADSHQSIHSQSCTRRRMLPHWHSLSPHDDVSQRVDLWTDSLQALHDFDFDNAIYIIHLPAHHVR